MKIVVALDSFKGSLGAEKACRLVADALRSMQPEAEIVIKPMADGGEGTAAAVMTAAGGQWIAAQVTGPLPEMQVDAGFVWLPDTHTAIVEMAAASGLTLLELYRQNPLRTTTYGTGQLIDAAIRHGAERILLGIGGSATVDGGVGAAAALGWSFLDANGREIDPGGGALSRIDRIVPPQTELLVPIDVLCDVDNPLCGRQGAAHVYGPQKGATPEMVQTLDAGLLHLAGIVREQLGRDVAHLPGAGAAGGMAAGAVAFMNARLVSGIDEVMAVSHLREELADADWIITGEGKFDAQSLRGKVVSGVARVAREAGVKVAVIAGQVALAPDAYHAAGIEAAWACQPDSVSLDFAMTNAAALIVQAAREFACVHLGSADRAAAVCYRRQGESLEFLLVRTHAGGWTFPKGRIEVGESPWSAAEREALEEAGVRGRVGRDLLTTYPYEKRKADGRRIEQTVAAYLLEVESTSDAAEPGRSPTWFRPEEARQKLGLKRQSPFQEAHARLIDVACAKIKASGS
jgi:glycerate kinase